MTLVTNEPMRQRFYAKTTELVARDDRIAVVIAEIGSSQLANARARHSQRVFNVGIREQLMIGVASGLAQAGLRPIVHSYAPFLVERPFEMLKIDLGHQGVGAVLVSIGASYDSAASGRTHQTPEDVALLATLPGWRIFVPGHVDEADHLLRAAADGDDLVYLRLTEQSNAHARPIQPGRSHVERRGAAATVIAVGPLLDPVLEATAGLDVTVIYATTVRPFDRETLRANRAGELVVLVEPYLAGTSSAEVAEALVDVPHRLVAIGVPSVEHRRYGSWAEHNAAHRLDVPGIRGRILRAMSRAA